MTSVSPTACLPHRASRTSNWELRNRESVLPFLRLKRREPNQGVSRRSNVSQHDDSGLAYRGSLLTVRVQTASAGLKARMPATPTRRLLPTLGATGPRVPSPTVRVATTSYRAPTGHDQRIPRNMDDRRKPDVRRRAYGPLPEANTRGKSGGERKKEGKEQKNWRGAKKL